MSKDDTKSMTATNQYRHPRPRIGKTRKDRQNGGRGPGQKNTKPHGERGHLFGKSRHAWRKAISKSFRAGKA